MKQNKTDPTDNMSLYTLCRWAALLEAVNLIGDKCEERNLQLEKYLNPLGIQKYVDTSADAYVHKYTTREMV